MLAKRSHIETPADALARVLVAQRERIKFDPRYSVYTAEQIIVELAIFAEAARKEMERGHDGSGTD